MLLLNRPNVWPKQHIAFYKHIWSIRILVQVYVHAQFFSNDFSKQKFATAVVLTVKRHILRYWWSFTSPASFP